MYGLFRASFVAVVLTSAGSFATGANAQNDQNPGPNHSFAAPAQPISDGEEASAENLLLVPEVHITPGGVQAVGEIKNPMANDPNSAERGMAYFNKFNCVGCHADNGGGGMGVSLSDGNWKFGSRPADVYLVISHGAPQGMPAWGSVLPDNVIWDLVSYVKGISKPPTTWGTTISPTSPDIQETPAEFKSTADPWNYIEPFSNGQKPTAANPTSSLSKAISNQSNAQ